MLRRQMSQVQIHPLIVQILVLIQTVVVIPLHRGNQHPILIKLVKNFVDIFRNNFYYNIIFYYFFTIMCTSQHRSINDKKTHLKMN